MSDQDLSQKKCVPCEGGTKPLNRVMVEGYLAQTPGWELMVANPSSGSASPSGQGDQIAKTFSFKNFYETMAFVNAVAFIANREDHHPDMEVSYKQCRVRYSTHAIKGLSENDFICAVKVNALIP
jgi:4a-hydroxytetrahydrobiopterin dehydratase